MSRADKTVVMMFLFTLFIGVVQYQVRLSKKKVAGHSEVVTSNAVKQGLPGSPWQVVLRPEEERISLADLRELSKQGEDGSVSFEERRQIAILAALERSKTQGEPEPFIFPPDFDYFAAKESMKEWVFSEEFDEQCQMTEEEKWELVESGNLPW